MTNNTPKSVKMAISKAKYDIETLHSHGLYEQSILRDFPGSYFFCRDQLIDDPQSVIPELIDAPGLCGYILKAEYPGQYTEQDILDIYSKIHRSNNDRQRQANNSRHGRVPEILLKVWRLLW